ncbi:MAG: hypothetical protein PHS97_02105 [Oscillospiraceae bacterium]|nr:hypothetical protein [Oscillospiraceae bacterium]
MAEHMPKYAAGSDVDNIRTGTVVNGYKRPQTHRRFTITPIIIIVLIFAALNYINGPETGMLENSITNAQRSADGNTIIGISTITNNTGKFLFDVTETITIQTETGLKIGEYTQDIKGIMKPNDTISKNIIIPIMPTDESLKMSYRMSYRRFIIGKMRQQ